MEGRRRDLKSRVRILGAEVSPTVALTAVTPVTFFAFSAFFRGYSSSFYLCASAALREIFFALHPCEPAIAKPRSPATQARTPSDPTRRSHRLPLAKHKNDVGTVRADEYSINGLLSPELEQRLTHPGSRSTYACKRPD